MPVHNGEPYLASAIRSILEQSHEDLELIISDNASTDATPEISRAFADEDARVRVVRSEENRGAMWNFNEVFRHARGEFFKPAAHDDLHEPDFLERCLAAYREAPPSVVLVHPRTLLIDGEGDVIGPYDDGLDLREREPAERLRHLFARVRMVNPLFGVHRSRVFASTRLFQGFVSADVVLLAELAMRGMFWELDAPLFLRRDHEGRSERAHGSAQELAAWYDPTQLSRISGRRVRQSRAMVRAAFEAPLSASDRARCLQVVATDWLWRWKRPMAEELVGSVRALVASVGR